MDRINYNVPKEFIPDIRVIAAEKGQEIPYWLRKVIEAAIKKEMENK